MTEGLDRFPDVIYELGAALHQRLPGAYDGQMSLAPFTVVLEWVEQLRIQTRQASQSLGAYLVGLSLVRVDEP